MAPRKSVHATDWHSSKVERRVFTSYGQRSEKRIKGDTRERRGGSASVMRRRSYSSAFLSKVPRFISTQNLSPGPGHYRTIDGTGVARGRRLVERVYVPLAEDRKEILTIKSTRASLGPGYYDALTKPSQGQKSPAPFNTKIPRFPSNLGSSERSLILDTASHVPTRTSLRRVQKLHDNFFIVKCQNDKSKGLESNQ